MSAIKIASLLIVTALFASMAPPCHGFGRHRNDNCPSEWFTTQFTATADAVVTADVLSSIFDSDLTFFRDIMQFSDEEIEKVTQEAIQFFATEFGLDFSQVTPDDQGQRILGNASLIPFFVPPELRYSVTFNFRLLTGSTRNRCFEFLDGGLLVFFTGEDTLHGTYGGPDGIPVFPRDELLYGFYNIPVSPQHPLIIPYTTITPVRIAPVDGFGIFNFELQHPVLGEGVARGLFRATPAGEPNLFRMIFQNVLSFPAHPEMS